MNIPVTYDEVAKRTKNNKSKLNTPAYNMFAHFHHLQVVLFYLAVSIRTLSIKDLF
jgi:hypothetical protein